MEEKFTKGNWHLLPTEKGNSNIVMCGKQRIGVASLASKASKDFGKYTVTNDSEESTANAKLFAAAPNLLDVLVKLIALRQKDSYNVFSYEEEEVINAGITAINKAI